MSPAVKEPRRRRPHRAAAFAVAVAAMVGPGVPAAAADGAATAVDAALDGKGLGPEALSVIDNLLRHETARRPHGVDADVLDLLGAPARVADRVDAMEGSLRRRVGIGRPFWRSLVDGAAATSAASCPVSARRVAAVVDWYVDELDALVARQATIRQACAEGGCPDAAAVAGAVTDDDALRRLIPHPAMAAAAAWAADEGPRFFALHGRLLACLRALPRPAFAIARPEFRNTDWGGVVIGSGGDDSYRAADAAVIVDLGGDDHYQLAPGAPGGVRAIIDVSGNDRYEGADPAILSAAVLVDLAGNDLYLSRGPGQAAALGGLSLLVDGGGDDAYAAAGLAQGAAVLGVAALIDAVGEDRYRVDAFGQGYGGPGGVGVLWDLAGDDTYAAAGAVGAEDRGGGLSWAQGVGRGLRTGHGGGIGVLLDDRGNDRYRAHLFAQGSGYYFGLGLLRDAAGDDRYEARRYAQGAGVHEAVGILADAAGDDSYTASVGVSQGMGLDTAVGVLDDGGGDDAYEAGSLAQGAGTANGTGIVVEAGGRDRFTLGHSGWGQDHWARGLPGPAFLIGADTGDTFVLGGKPRVFASMPPAGPHAALPPRPPQSGFHACPEAAGPGPPSAPLEEDDPLTLLRRSAPKYGSDDAATAAYRSLAGGLPAALPGYLAAVPVTDFATAFSLLEVVRCWSRGADAAAAESFRRLSTGVLRRTTPHPRPWLIVGLLARLPGSIAERRPAVEALSRHPSCGARAGALDLVRGAHPADGAAPPWLRRLVEGVLGDACWRLNAAALGLLAGRPALATAVGPPPPHIPGFLRRRWAAAGGRGKPGGE